MYSKELLAPPREKFIILSLIIIEDAESLGGFSELSMYLDKGEFQFHTY